MGLAFADALGGLASVIATDLSLRFTPNDHVKVTNSWLDPNLPSTDLSTTAFYKNISGGMGKDLVCELDTEGLTVDEYGQMEVGTVVMTYKNNGGEEVVLEKTLKMQMGRDEEEIREIMKNWLRVTTADEITKATKMNNNGE